MRWCSRCGREVELHTKAQKGLSRECCLVEVVDDESLEHPLTIHRANAEEYSKLRAAHVALHAERFDD